MHWDMEGVSGLFTREQTWYREPGVPEQVGAQGRQLLMDDISAAAAAALAAGADEIIICDTHGGGGNIDPARMLADARITYLLRSTGYQNGEFRWMPGLDHSVDALMLLGHHARAGTAGAFLPHTENLEWQDVRINGQSVGELGLEACYAGHWDIPLALVHGEEAGCAEARAQFPGVVTVSVKRALSHDLCTGPDAATAHQLTAEKIAEALDGVRKGKARPFQPALPMTVTVRMASVEAAERAAGRPGVRRLDAHTVEGQVARRCDVVQWLTGTGLAMTPRA
jgi:D-amino peptidase